MKQRIQERRQVEEQIENLAKFPSENPNPVLRITKDGKLLYANDASNSLLTEWDCREGQTVPDYWCQVVSKAFTSGKQKRVETEHLGRTLSFEITPVFEADYANLYGRDITERKQAEEALHQYEHIVSSSTDMLAILDKRFNYLAANKAYIEAFKLSSEQLIGNTVADVFGEEFFKTVIKPNADRCLLGEEVNYQDWFDFPACGRRYMDINYYPYCSEDNKIIGFVVNGRNITERKQAEEERKNLAKFPSENPNPVLRITKDGILLYANAASRFFLAEWNIEVGQVVPDTWCQTIAEVLASGSHRRVEAEYAGRIFAFVVAPVQEADYVNLYGRDITERKEIASRQELAGKILERLNRKSEAFDMVRDIITLIKESTGFAAVGIRLCEGDDFPYFIANGFDAEFIEAEKYLCARDQKGEIIYDSQGKPVLECMCGNVLSGRTDSALPFFTEGGSFWTNSTTKLLASTSPEQRMGYTRNRCNTAGYESLALIPLRSGDQTVGLLQLNDTSPDRFTPEMISFFEGICASIGIALARIEAEQEIKNMAKFPSENPYPVLRIAKDGVILYANSAGSELLEDWGCEVGSGAPEHWCQYVLRILRSGSSEELEVVCRDRIFSLITAPVVEAGYVNIYGTDITKHKRAEEDLRKYRHHLEELVEERTGKLTEANKQLLEEVEGRKRLEKEILNISEREQQRLGQELHDSLGQQLTGVAFMTKVLEQKLTTKSPEEAADVAEIAKLVNQATAQARGLARGLHPVDLDASSLMSSLEELAASMEQLFGVRCTFKCDKPVEVDDTEVAVHLYRIAQEAVTNAIKHGRAKNIRIGLAYGRNKSVMTVKSDGLDFPKEFEARGTGMGLQIMDHRADIIGGSLDIRGGAKGGTIVTCEFPGKKCSQ